MQHLIKIFEILALVSALYWGRGISKISILAFKCLLGVIVFSELVSFANTNFQLGWFATAKWYNFFIPLEFGIYLFIFREEATSRSWKNFILVSGAVFLATAVVGMLLNIAYFNTWLYSAGVLLLSAVCLQYIYREITGTRILHISGNIFFYIAAGVVLFYLGTLPYHAMRNQLYEHYPGIFWVYYYVFLVLDCLMYALFAFGMYQFRRSFIKKPV